MFFFKQKTAYEMRISDWSSDVCSSDLLAMIDGEAGDGGIVAAADQRAQPHQWFLELPTRGSRSETSMSRISSGMKIGRASCRERVCQYVYISVVAVSLKTK